MNDFIKFNNCATFNSGNHLSANIRAMSNDVYDDDYLSDLERDCKVEVKYVQQSVPNRYVYFRPIRYVYFRLLKSEL